MTDGFEIDYGLDLTDAAPMSVASPPPIGFDSSLNRAYGSYGRSTLVTAQWSLATEKTGAGGADSLADTNQPPREPFYRVNVRKPQRPRSLRADVCRSSSMRGLKPVGDQNPNAGIRLLKHETTSLIRLQWVVHGTRCLL